MARKKRPWRLGNKEKKPKDPRLWLYGRVPSGFWREIGNQRLYLEWLGEQLGFTKPEDWYQLSYQDLEQRHGSRLLAKFNGSVAAMLRDYRPDYDWKEWLFLRSPKSFWKQADNRRRYLDWLGTQLGYQRPEDWAGLRQADLFRHGGQRLLRKLHLQVSQIVDEYLGTQKR